MSDRISTRKPPESYEETRSRLHAAVLTVGVSAPPRPRPHLTCWPEYEHEDGDVWEAVLAEVQAGTFKSPEPRFRFQPSRAEIDDCLYALSWLAKSNGEPPLERWQWRLLHRRAWQGLRGGRIGSWRTIADAMADHPWRMARSHEWWRARHNDLVERAYRVAHASSPGQAKTRFDNLTETGPKQLIIAPRVRAA